MVTQNEALLEINAESEVYRLCLFLDDALIVLLINVDERCFNTDRFCVFLQRNYPCKGISLKRLESQFVNVCHSGEVPVIEPKVAIFIAWQVHVINFK